MGEYRVLCPFLEILTNRGRYLISPAGRHSPSTTPVITACMPRSWKVEVCQKKKSRLVEKMIIQQSAARRTSSMEQHKLIFFSCVPTRPLALGGNRLQQRSQGPQQHQSTPSSKESCREKKTPNVYDAIYGTKASHSLVSSVDDDLCVAQLGNMIVILGV